MQNFLLVVSFVLMACCLTNCQGNIAIGPDGGSGEFSAPTTTTTYNSSCHYGSGKACDPCHSALECGTSGALCVGLSTSSDGICAPSCSHDCECPPDFTCTPVGQANPITVCLPKGGVCEPTCTCNQDCTAPNTACDGTYCRSVCTSDADCAETPGFVCTDLKVCAPPATPGVQCNK